MKIFLISQAIKIVGIKGHITLHLKKHSNGLKVNIYVLFVVNLSHFKILAHIMLARLLSVKLQTQYVVGHGMNNKTIHWNSIPSNIAEFLSKEY